MAQDRYQELRVQALARYRAGDVREATRIQCELVNGPAEQVKSADLKLLAFLFFNIGDLKQSLIANDRYLELNPEDIEALSNKAAILKRTRAPGDVIPVLERVLALDPGNENALAMLCELRFRTGD